MSQKSATGLNSRWIHLRPDSELTCIDLNCILLFSGELFFTATTIQTYVMYFAAWQKSVSWCGIQATIRNNWLLFNFNSVGAIIWEKINTPFCNNDSCSMSYDSDTKHVHFLHLHLKWPFLAHQIFSHFIPLYDIIISMLLYIKFPELLLHRSD